MVKGFASGVLMAALAWAGAVQAEGVAPDEPARILLWGKLFSGMSLREVKDLYPGFKAELATDCPVRVLSQYQKSRLVSVILLGHDDNAECSHRILADLTQKYGEGAKEYHEQSGISALHYAFRREDIVWHAEGRRVTLALMPGGYNLIFTIRSDGKLY